MRDGELPYGHLSVARAAREAQLHETVERTRFRKLLLCPYVAVGAYPFRNRFSREDHLRDLAVLIAHPAKKLLELFVDLGLVRSFMKLTFYMEWAIRCCHAVLPYRLSIDIRFQACAQENSDQDNQVLIGSAGKCPYGQQGLDDRQYLLDKYLTFV